MNTKNIQIFEVGILFKYKKGTEFYKKCPTATLNSKSSSYLSPGTSHPLRGRAALKVTAHPRGGPTMFRTLGLWQRVPALPALTQDHTVPVARTTAGRALQTEQEMKKEGEKEKKKNIRQGGREMEAM